MKTIVLATALTLAAFAAHAGEPIEGNWKTASGETAAIAACGSSYCITLKTGKFSGKQIGKFVGTDGSYTGEITDPAENKTYSGSGTISGNALKMKGCVLKILCKSQTWTRI